MLTTQQTVLWGNKARFSGICEKGGRMISPHPPLSRGWSKLQALTILYTYIYVRTLAGESQVPATSHYTCIQLLDGAKLQWASSSNFIFSPSPFVSSEMEILSCNKKDHLIVPSYILSKEQSLQKHIRQSSLKSLYKRKLQQDWFIFWNSYLTNVSHLCFTPQVHNPKALIFLLWIDKV